MNHPAIELRNVTYRYPTSPVDSLRNVSLTIPQGEFCAVIGPNGAGKTTLLSAMRGFAPKFYEGKFSGEVLVDGENIADKGLGDLSVKMGYVFQNPFTQISGCTRTVFEEIAYGLENLGVAPGKIRKRVEEVLELIHIGFLRERNPYDLSGGQQQRVAFGSILAMDPDIYIIDEPTSQLDPQGTEEIFAIIEMMKRRQKTIVLVEHKMDLIAKYAERVVLVEDGGIAFDGTAEKVLANPALPAHHTAMTKYAELGHALRKAGWDIPVIPIDFEGAVACARAALAKEADQ